jgi:hypothetical protein
MPPSHCALSARLAGYTQSPLCIIEEQDDSWNDDFMQSTQVSHAKPATRLQPETKGRHTNRNARDVSLRHAILNALGSGEPVELLKYASDRSSSDLRRATSASSPPESHKSSITNTAIQKKCPGDSDSRTKANGTGIKFPDTETDDEAVSDSRTLDGIIYTTPAGRGN